ncbi:MAG: radical SAM protein [Bacteroidales bacterium]|nr:radical SAM protein [Bacteroidales bacterium]
MLRFDDIAYGPIHSRRLGSSLGINISPRSGKLCNFDCIYCECGWNADGREDHILPSLKEVVEAIETKLKFCSEAGTPIDSITFSGHGEPTLHPDFEAVIDATIALRNRYYPEAKISVLSNSTRLSVSSVKSALLKIDNPILKLDGPSMEVISLINKPEGSYNLNEVIENLASFHGDFVLQTMMLYAPNEPLLNLECWIFEWMKLVRLLHPRQVMVYTLDRPSPDTSLRPLAAGYIKTLLQPLKKEGFNIQINA